MNIFTCCQLINQTKPTVYYDTKSNNIKLSTIPTLTMLGNDAFDVHVTKPLNNNPNENKNKNKNKNVFNIIKKKKEIKKYSDDLRCCANTNNGNICSLKRYSLKSEDLCYIHYKQKQQNSKFNQNKKETEIEIESKKDPISKTKTKKWYSWFITIF